MSILQSDEPMTLVLTTSPSFGLYGTVPHKLAERGWQLERCLAPKDDPDGFSAQLARADFLVVGLPDVDDAVLSRAGNLKAVLKHGVGVDNIDIAACTARRLPVLNTPAANANAVAELALANIFALSRDLVGLHTGVLGGRWDRPVAREVEGATLGVVGLGSIGKILARKAAALGMTVLATDLYPDHDFAAQHGIEIVDLPALLERSDFVSLHVFGGSGGPVIGKAELDMTKPGAFILNMARGDVVDLNALGATLASGHLSGAALDAFEPEPPNLDHPIFARTNTVFTPHIGASTGGAVERVGLMNIEDMETLLSGGQPRRTLNPEVFPA